MRRLVYLVVAVALTGATVYLYFKNAAASSGGAARGQSAPRQRLDQASRVAKDIERNTQIRVDDLAKKTE